MRICFLSNNGITKTLSDWLGNKARDDVILFSQKITLDIVRHINPDFIISYNYRYIIDECVLNFMKNRTVNLHISLLPWNRGAHPNFWSFMHDTPKGVTIHLIDAGIDTGDILFQKEICFGENIETSRTLYMISHKEIQRLFMSRWGNLKHFKIQPFEQKGEGTFHRSKDFEIIKSVMGENVGDVPITV
jgi:methionyl-tRNA formyltransferase